MINRDTVLGLAMIALILAVTILNVHRPDTFELGCVLTILGIFILYFSREIDKKLMQK